jgi:ubiquitin carboxyl-terminal hydrolase 14
VYNSHTFSVKVKWNKDVFPVEADTTQEPILFKSQLYALSNVPVDKQKIMIKGKMLKDTDDMSKMGLANNMTIMMMGTAEDKGLKEPAQAIKFFEDMTPEEKARALNQTLAIAVPPGLTNLGNTCYMASTIQVLKRVNELKAALANLNSQQVQMGDTDMRLAVEGGKLMKQLDKI